MAKNSMMGNGNSENTSVLTLRLRRFKYSQHPSLQVIKVMQNVEVCHEVNLQEKMQQTYMAHPITGVQLINVNSCLQGILDT